MVLCCVYQLKENTWTRNDSTQSMLGRIRDALLCLTLSLRGRRSITNMLPANNGDSASAVGLRTGTTLLDGNGKLSAGVGMRTKPAPPMIGVCAVQPKYNCRWSDVVAMATPVMTWRNWAVLAGAAINNIAATEWQMIRILIVFAHREICKYQRWYSNCCLTKYNYRVAQNKVSCCAVTDISMARQ